MAIKVNTDMLISEASHASSLSSQLRGISFELNNIYFSLDAEIKNRESIGSSLIILLGKMDKIQKKMYNVSRFLDDTASRYRSAERAVAANGARISLLSTLCASTNGVAKSKDVSNGWFVPVVKLAKQTKPGDYVYRTPEIKATKKQGVISYLKSSARQLLLGNYTDDVTALGTGAQVVIGISGFDFPLDIRDLSADFKNWKWTGDHVGQTALDTVGLIPAIGVFKNIDEIGTLAKGAKKADDFKIAKSIKVGEKAEIGSLAKAGEGLKKVDGITEGISSTELALINQYPNNNIFNKSVSFNAGENGTGINYKVFQRNDIEWNMVRITGAKKGRGLTNAQAAEKYGLAPILDVDGKVATLHHSQQQSIGPLFEASTRYHNIGNAKKAPLHPYNGKLNLFNPMSEETRKAFQKVDSIEYWRTRGRDSMKGVK